MPQPDRSPAAGRRVADGVDQVRFTRALRVVKELSTLVLRVSERASRHAHFGVSHLGPLLARRDCPGYYQTSLL
jgi:hypothetical protein